MNSQRTSLHLMQSQCENKTCVTHRMMQILWTHWFYICFCMHGCQKLEDPKIEHLADDAITLAATV